VRITRPLEIVGSPRCKTIAAAEDGRAPGQGLGWFQVESSRNFLIVHFSDDFDVADHLGQSITDDGGDRKRVPRKPRKK
jgi:hypothetical protein